MTGRRVVILLVGAAAVVLVVWALRMRAAAQARSATASAAVQGGRAGGDRPVPVVVATAEARDVPIYLEGLGSVAAFYTVTVHSQIDGPMVSVGFTEGQVVHRGDLIAQIDPRPWLAALHTAEGALERDRATLRANQRTLARDATLRTQNYVAPQDYDTQLGLVEQSQGAIRVDQGQVETARVNLSYARIVAPIDGVTGVRQVDPGNLVHPSDANGIVVITQVQPIAVFFTLPEDVLPAVTRAMAQGPLSVSVFSRDGQSELDHGTLALVDNQINQNTATIRLKAIFDNANRSLWPDQFVKARLLVTTQRGAIVIPAAAIQRSQTGAFVYLVAADPAGHGQRVQVRPVVVDSTQGESAIIRTGLAAGDVVVIDGQSRLRPNAQVTTRTAEEAAAEANSPAGGGAHGGHGGHGGGHGGSGGDGGVHRGGGDGGTGRHHRGQADGGA